MKCSKCGSLCYAESDNSSGINMTVSSCCKAQIIYIQKHNTDYSNDMFQSCSHPNFSGYTTGMTDKTIILESKIEQLQSEKAELIELLKGVLDEHRSTILGEWSEDIYNYSEYDDDYVTQSLKWLKKHNINIGE